MKSANRRQTYGYQGDVTIDVDCATPPPVGRWMREWIWASASTRQEIEQFAMEEFQHDVRRREQWAKESPTPAAEVNLRIAREKLAALEEWTRRVSAAAE